MEQKEAFKNFCRSNPGLVNFINSGEMTWQKFYEMYDIYGPNDSIWDKYKSSKQNEDRKGFDFSSIGNIIKNVNVDNIEKHITNAQKALGFIEEITTSKAKEVAEKIPKVPKKPNGLNKFFED